MDLSRKLGLFTLAVFLAAALGAWVSAQDTPIPPVVSHVIVDSGSVTVTVTPATVASASLSNVSASASSVTLSAANTSRKGWAIFNDSTTANLFVKFGTTASATSYTVKILAGGFYEMPGPPIYTGQLDGIWDVAAGAARVTEF